jgi:hypothetical protein
LRGNYQFFERSEQNWGVINQLNKSGIGEHIYCVLCGRMTPDQKIIVCHKLPRYVPYKGTYVPYDATYGTSDQGQTLDV